MATPRYLFRISDRRSPGTTDMVWVKSPVSSGSRLARNDNVYAHNNLPERAAVMLNNHLRWKCGGECYVMSWTNSLLVAVVYGLYRHQVHGTPLSDIRLLIVDTSKFERGMFFRDLDLMDAYRSADQGPDGLQNMYDLRTVISDGEFYFGEYLSVQDVYVRGKCAQTTMRDLMGCGLASFRPEMTNRDPRWAKRVVELRGVFGGEMPTTETPEVLVRRAIELARECFWEVRDAWTLPVAAMVLSLVPRRRNDETMVRVFRNEFTGAFFSRLTTWPSFTRGPLLTPWDVGTWRPMIR
ncbi:hypothetical protein SODALDRAFT_218193 [Sodiomyces alkalinus F11]|uniref:DUF7587 domain-containing protein n=1 Tax=Sodiomyces alkalinus (strain CBS 110278 / VKM F-3762 / F11) TaxID=1314773 RepID=A0A3N2PPD6_SODAK|nr:hypothetical protein SODALDRAFT_218193 [Sodiomyces alkalinus F11]ROT36369.1 hypothetical protein SODALDRAFT_218193 [Sodiomyces alkalinus F11]